MIVGFYYLVKGVVSWMVFMFSSKCTKTVNLMSNIGSKPFW